MDFSKSKNGFLDAYRDRGTRIIIFGYLNSIEQEDGGQFQL